MFRMKYWLDGLGHPLKYNYGLLYIISSTMFQKACCVLLNYEGLFFKLENSIFLGRFERTLLQKSSL